MQISTYNNSVIAMNEAIFCYEIVSQIELTTLWQEIASRLAMTKKNNL